MTLEIIVLLVVALVFGALAAALLWAWKRPMYPAGKRLTYKWTDYKVHLIINGVNLSKNHRKKLAKKCVKVAYALDRVWGDRRRKGNIKEFVAVFVDPELFVYPGKDDTSKIPAYLTTCSYRVGGGYIPMMVAKEKHIEEVILKGEPLIHELCHELLGEHTIDRQGHNEHEVWRENSGDLSLQHQAQKLYQASL